MKLLLVVNPVSGGKNKTDFLKRAGSFFRKYGIACEYYNTTGKDDLQRLRALIKQYEPDRVASVGGDGTTLLTSLALQHAKIPFGIIPMGSANGMARELHVPADPMQALEDLILTQHIIPIDIVKLNEHYSMHMGGVGINANIVKEFEKESRRGWGAYAKHFFNELKNAESFDVTIMLKNEVIRQSAYSVLIANTRMYGTGVIMNSKGNPHDGLFEIVLITKKDWKGLLNLGLTAWEKSGSKILDEYLITYQVSAARIHLSEPRVLQLDGEVIGNCTTITAEILAGEVRYATTDANPFTG